MSRNITVAAAQLGPIQMAEPRSVAVERMVRLMERAHRRGVELVVFPELALTTFFPRHYHADISEADHWFETAMPSNVTAPLFAAARRYGIGFHLGYAEMTEDRRRFNTSILVNPDGDILLKYRKVHLPGHAEFDPRRKVQHLEKRYFEVGDLGFPVIRAPMGEVAGINMGMLICNDRRWPEAWRVLGLQSVELVALGYNTPSLNMEAGGFEAHHLRVFHSHLSIQAGCYQNACFAVATAKAGTEDGCELFGHSIIVNPQGEIIAMAASWDDELITADCDLDMCALGRTTIFAFEKHRRPETYGRITGQTGAVEPPEWSSRGVNPALTDWVPGGCDERDRCRHPCQDEAARRGTPVAGARRQQAAAAATSQAEVGRPTGRGGAAQAGCRGLVRQRRHDDRCRGLTRFDHRHAGAVLDRRAVMRHPGAAEDHRAGAGGGACARGVDQSGACRIRLQQRLHRHVQRDLGGQSALQPHRPQRGEMAGLGGIDDGDHAEPLGARHGDRHRRAEHAEHRPLGRGTRGLDAGIRGTGDHVGIRRLALDQAAERLHHTVPIAPVIDRRRSLAQGDDIEVAALRADGTGPVRPRCRRNRQPSELGLTTRMRAMQILSAHWPGRSSGPI